jgi:predicted acetyltransferase
MMELYQYDFSEFEGTDLDQHGCFGYWYLDHYWVEKGRHPFIVCVDGKLAGFVLVNQHTHIPGNEHSIAEFLILRKYRRRGIGKRVAFHIFDLFPGNWEVGQTESNTVAQQFWRSVVGQYTAVQFAETVLNTESWKGHVQYFDNTRKAQRP